MRSGEYENDGDELGESASMDPFEQVAQAIVAQVRGLVDRRASYQPVDASDYPERDRSYYDTTEQELAALGFQTVGDFEDASLIVSDPSRRSFVRFGLGAHGAIGAMWFEAPAQDGDALRCLVLHSWLADGRVLITGRGMVDSGLPMPPEITVEHVEKNVDTKATVRAHGERVAATRLAPHRLSGAAELFERHATDESSVAAFRRDQGIALFEPLFRAMLGASYQLQGQPILHAIERHPEWLSGELPSVSDTSGNASRDPYPHVVIARIQEHIEPIERGSRYEDPLQDALTIRALGAVTGGGSQLTPDTEIGYVEIEVALTELEEGLEVTKRVLEEAGAPVGSQLVFVRDGAEVERPFGIQEALAVYLDGSNLPDEVYQETDIDALMQRLAAAVESVGGELRGAWSGPAETALYHYGPSADAMLDALQGVFDDFPICQNARLVIRQGSDGDARVMRVTRRDAA